MRGFQEDLDQNCPRDAVTIQREGRSNDPPRQASWSMGRILYAGMRSFEKVASWKMIDNTVAQGVTVDLQTPPVLQLNLTVVGQVVDVHFTVRLILIGLDHGPVCLRVSRCVCSWHSPCWTRCSENSGVRSTHSAREPSSNRWNKGNRVSLHVTHRRHSWQRGKAIGDELSDSNDATLYTSSLPFHAFPS